MKEKDGRKVCLRLKNLKGMVYFRNMVGRRRMLTWLTKFFFLSF